jgi:hypothetical protein
MAAPYLVWLTLLKLKVGGLTQAQPVVEALEVQVVVLTVVMVLV